VSLNSKRFKYSILSRNRKESRLCPGCEDSVTNKGAIFVSFLHICKSRRFSYTHSWECSMDLGYMELVSVDTIDEFP